MTEMQRLALFTIIREGKREFSEKETFNLCLK